METPAIKSLLLCNLLDGRVDLVHSTVESDAGVVVCSTSTDASPCSIAMPGVSTHTVDRRSSRQVKSVLVTWPWPHTVVRTGRSRAQVSLGISRDREFVSFAAASVKMSGRVSLMSSFVGFNANLHPRHASAESCLRGESMLPT